MMRRSLLCAVVVTLAFVRADAAWPPPANDTGFNYSDPANWPNDPSFSGEWKFWSFVPSQIMNQVDEVTKRLGTGSHYDRAWAKTTGDPRVLIAYTDSGIEWDNGELVNKLFLNAGELPPPQGCPGADGVTHDVNGDGKFNVQDYTTATGHMLPAAAMICDPRVTDRNGNGVLDAQDLIRAFTNMVDDDGNGYIDDISGWDFFHNDNDPHDDTGFGHGTGSSQDGVAEGNNGSGGIGTCPDCTLVMLRMGDAFVPEDSKWGVAVAYATDLGASVIDISGGGGLSNTPLSRDAITYAYDNNVTIIASNSDLDSFHHNYPNTNDHIISVHAIEFDHDKWQTSTTFFNYETCTNYGAQLMLSIPATGCSSEASGRAGGLAGLLYAAALKADVPTPFATSGDPQGNRRLTAEEVRQLLIGTVDNFYNPMDAMNPLKYPTKMGFARRFGYGRPNARTAVDAIINGALPPEVDITSPEWFTTIYTDKQQTLSVDGRIAIRGAAQNPAGTTFDYVAEWAPGVDPDDAQFQTIGHGEMLTTELKGPLATWDVSNLTINNPVPALGDKAWQPDDVSNVHTVTLRVRATIHSTTNPLIDGVKGEARRAIHLHKDPDLLAGWPIFLAASGESSPKIADLDGDGKNELILAESSGFVHALRADGTELAGWPVKVELLPLLDPQSHQGKGHATAPAFASGKLPSDVRSPMGSTVAIGDIDGDGKPEVVAATWQGYVWAWHAGGGVVSGFPVELDRDTEAVAIDRRHELEDGFWASPVLADLDQDKVFEIVCAGMDAKLYAWKGTGARVEGFPVTVQDTTLAPVQRQRIMTTPAAGDFNHDGVPDFVVGTNENVNDQQGRLYIVDGRGTKAPGGAFLPGWPISVVSTRFLPVVAQGLPNSPAIADLDGDKVPEVLESGLASTLKMYNAQGKPYGVFLGNNSTKYGAKTDAHNMIEFMMVANPAVADLDDDGTLDLLEGGAGSDVALAFASDASRHDFEHHMGAWDSKTGKFKNGFPRVIEDWQFFSTPAVADIDNDGRVEVIASSAGYFVHAWNVDGVEPKGWPKFTGMWNMSTPAVGDLDGDGKLEVVQHTRNGWLFAWHTTGTTKGRIDWESFHHDNQNTGNYDTVLDQGKRASPGGCAAAGGAEAAPPWSVIAVAALALAVGYVRRRRNA
jgi:MYXO-CTERM domain-containing protein